MNGDRRKTGTNIFMVGTVIFLIGINAEILENLIDNWNPNVRIVNWGWMLILTGGIIAAHGFLTLLDAQLHSMRPPLEPGMPQQPSYPFFAFLMDTEVRKMIWVTVIAVLVLFIVMPGLLCSSFVLVLVMILVVLLLMGGGWQPRYPPYYYPVQPPPPMPFQNMPPPHQTGKVTLCSSCHAQLELSWKACPFCGQRVGTAETEDNQ